MNFTTLFKDSWNFMRNQRLFVIVFWVIFTLSIVVMTNIDQTTTNVEAMNNASGQQSLQSILAQSPQDLNAQLGTLFKQILSLFVSSWVLVSIHQLSQRTPLNLGQTAVICLRRFLGVICLDLVSLALLGIGVVNGLLSLLQGQSSFISLVLIIVGIIWFVRTCLASLAYLIGSQPFRSAIPSILKQGKGRSSTLFIYCLICYFVFPFLLGNLSALSHNILFSLVMSGITAFVNLFILVFSYRFYTQFIQQTTH